VPLPELGPVEPMLWSELDAGLDGQMLAAGGVWLESAADAGQAYPDEFSAHAVKKSRQRGRARSARKQKARARAAEYGENMYSETFL
jgi:hypothetical protein